jgi:hypothetical protein
MKKYRSGIRRNVRTNNDAGPLFKRRFRDGRLGQADDIQVVADPCATMTRTTAARASRMALLETAGPAEVGAAGICQKDVGAAIARLSSAFQLPTEIRQSRDIRVVIDGDENVGVFWRRLAGRERSDDRDSQNSPNALRIADELRQRSEKELANAGFRVHDVRSNACAIRRRRAASVGWRIGQASKG